MSEISELQNGQYKPYVTLGSATHCEIPPIKGSRFIAYAQTVKSDDEAMAYIAEIKESYPDAHHWCWAYQLLTDTRNRCNDDGEPTGSAGKPILAPLLGRELMNTIIVVVRYFGGVKLGVGGLVKAYSQAANAVLEQAEIVTVVPTVVVEISYSYNDTAQVASALAHLGLAERDIQYSDIVTSLIDVVPAEVAHAQETLINYTAGKACVRIWR